MFLKSELLHAKHAFATRKGGVSCLPHTKSLNLAFGRGDPDDIVLENLQIFADMAGFDPKSVVSLPQIHSDTIYKVDKADRGKGYYIREDIPEGDGYITNLPGVTLGIKTADCLPILLEARRDGEVMAIGAVHAGWRGSVAGIGPKCVRMLCREYGVRPTEIYAVLGPCIHACCYEVGEDLFLAAKEGVGELAEKYIRPEAGKAGKYLCDLVGLNRALLLEAGLLEAQIDLIDRCTCCEPDAFFSHRYSAGLRGTMLNVITITP